jgi:AsmA protein
MRRKISIILAAVGVLIVVLIVLPFLIPVNQFRPTIEQKASAALGRKVALGNLSFSLLGGSLSAEDLSIAEDAKFGQSQFFTAKSLKVGVELLPLIFSRKLNVTGVTINNPRLTLLRDNQGRWNFSSLGGAPGQQQPKAATPASSAGEFSVKSFELKDGQVIIGSTTSNKRSTYDHVDVTASNFSMTSAFPIMVSADLPGGGKFKLEGKAGPIAAADAALTPVDAKLKISALNLASTGVLNPSAGLGGLLDLDATLRSQNGVAATNGTATLSKALLVAGGSPASVPLTADISTNYDLRKNAGVLNPSTVKIGNAAAHLNGTYQTEADNTVLKINVDGQNMPAKDLVSFLPAIGINMPKGASLSSGTLNTNLALTGPTNALITAGNVGLFGAKLTGFDLGSKMSSISSLAGLQTGKDLDIEKLTTNLRMSPDGLKADNFLAVLPAIGNLAGGGTIDSKNNLDFKMVATLTNAAAAKLVPISSGAGMLGKLTGGGGCKSGPTVPFLIQGTTSEPKFVPDVKGLAAGMVKSQLGCAGGAGGAAGAAGALTKQPVPKSLGDLGGLFGKKK